MTQFADTFRVPDQIGDIVGLQTALNAKANLAGGNGFTGVQTITNQDTAGIQILSGLSSKWSGLTIGRTATECNWGIAAAAAQWFSTTVAGDVFYRVEDSTKKLQVGFGNAGGAADFIFASGGLTIAGKQINFGSANASPPSSSVGYKLVLWDSGVLSTTYGIGIDSNTVWFQSGGTQFQWYIQGSVLGTLDNSGVLTLGNNSASASSVILNATGSSWYYNLQGGANRFAAGYRNTTDVYTFTRWNGSAFIDTFSIGRLTGQATFANSIVQTVQTGTVSSGLVATNAQDGNVFAVAATANFTLSNPTNPTDGQKITWRIRQDSTGGRTLTLGSAFRLKAGASAPVIATGVSKVSYLTAVYNVTDAKWDVVDFQGEGF
jgi:hypothetical protein